MPTPDRKPTHVIRREWPVGPDATVYVDLPCDARGAVRLSPDEVDAIKEYVDLLRQEQEICERARAKADARRAAVVTLQDAHDALLAAIRSQVPADLARDEEWRITAVELIGALQDAAASCSTDDSTQADGHICDQARAALLAHLGIEDTVTADSGDGP